VRCFVEQQTFSDRVTGPQCYQANRAAVDAFLDRHGTIVDDDRDFTICTFFENDLVALVRDFRDELRELVDRGVGEPGQETRFPEVLTDGRGVHR
jgi:hypothetical protein